MYRAHTNVWGVYEHVGAYGHSPKCRTYLPLRQNRNILFKAEFLHLKSWKIIREPPDHTGNEPTLDIPIGGLWAGHKKQNGAYMPFVRNMLIMKHVHHLSTEKEGKKF